MSNTTPQFTVNSSFYYCKCASVVILFSTKQIVIEIGKKNKTKKETCVRMMFYTEHQNLMIQMKRDRLNGTWRVYCGGILGIIKTITMAILEM